MNKLAPIVALSGTWIAAHRRPLGAAFATLLGGFAVTAFGVAPLLPDPSDLPQRVVVDMSGLEFLSSLPLGELVAMSRAVKLHGGRVVIAGARPAVREMLSHVRIDQIMPCFDGVDAALSAP